jgi:hypothetical protein
LVAAATFDVAWRTWAVLWPEPIRADFAQLGTATGRRRFARWFRRGFAGGFAAGLAAELALWLPNRQQLGLGFLFISGLVSGVVAGFSFGVLTGS